MTPAFGIRRIGRGPPEGARPGRGRWCLCAREVDRGDSFLGGDFLWERSRPGFPDRQTRRRTPNLTFRPESRNPKRRKRPEPARGRRLLVQVPIDRWVAVVVAGRV